MHKVILNAPSSASDAELLREEQSKSNHSKNIILILIGIIICLLIIIIVILLTPVSPSLTADKLSIKKNTLIIPETPSVIIDKQKEETSAETEEKLQPQAEIVPQLKKELIPEAEVVNIDKKQKEFISEQLKKELLVTDFNKAISDTLNAIEKKEFILARKKLQIAQNIKADESVINDLQQRINAGLKKRLINSLTKKAAKQEFLENWYNALNYYNKIIKIDAHINSILVKYQRTQLYLKLNKILDKIVSKPQRLQNDIVFNQAKKSLNSIKDKINNPISGLYPLQKTPKLVKKINETEKIIKKASTLVIVSIISDNLTDIMIYKRAHPGLLMEEKLKLRPGKYIIKGSRDGYKDIKEDLIIHPADQNRSITIICREAI